MNETESQWDKLLKIKTTGRDDSHADQYRYPYEPDTLFRAGTSGKQRPYRKRKYSIGLWHRERESLLLSILPDSLPFHRRGIR